MEQGTGKLGSTLDRGDEHSFAYERFRVLIADTTLSLASRTQGG